MRTDWVRPKNIRKQVNREQCSRAKSDPKIKAKVRFNRLSRAEIKAKIQSKLPITYNLGMVAGANKKKALK